MILAKKLKGSKIIDINSVVIGHDAFLRDSRGIKTDEVNIKKLARLIEKESKLEDKCIIVGHLAPYLLNPKDVSLVVVLRRSPYHLSKTLKKRGYTIEKTNDNVVSEILDICLFDTLKVFGIAKTTEIDTSEMTPPEVADVIISTLWKNSNRKIGATDWISLICKNGDLAKFLQL